MDELHAERLRRATERLRSPVVFHKESAVRKTQLKSFSQYVETRPGEALYFRWCHFLQFDCINKDFGGFCIVEFIINKFMYLMHKDEHVCYIQVCGSVLPIRLIVKWVLKCLLKVFKNTNSLIIVLYGVYICLVIVLMEMSDLSDWVRFIWLKKSLF